MAQEHEQDAVWEDPDHSAETDDAWHDHSGEAPPQESHGTTSPVWIFVVGLGSFALLVVVVALTAKYFDLSVQEEVVQKVEKRDLGTEYEEKKAVWQSQLSTYAMVNADEGVVRVPIDQAIRKTVQHYRSQSGGGAE